VSITCTHQGCRWWGDEGESWQLDQNNTFPAFTFHFEQDILVFSGYVYFCFSNVLKWRGRYCMSIIISIILINSRW
jgi:hypothetical protein